MEEIKNVFIGLINRYGDNAKELFTFDYCTEYGIDLGGSTIDKIALLADNNVLFYYNENTNDIDTISAFSIADLEEFAKELTQVINIVKSRYVQVCCYNRIEFWEERENALAYYKKAVRECEGAEQERYQNIVWDLEDGKYICVDEYRQGDKDLQYDFCATQGYYAHFNNPHNTRDYDIVVENFS